MLLVGVVTLNWMDVPLINYCYTLYYIITDLETNIPALTVACVNVTSDSVTVLMTDVNKCRLAKVEVTAGRANCFATGLNLYLCAGLEPQTTYTISAISNTQRSNGSVVMTTLGTTVCSTGEYG